MRFSKKIKWIKNYGSLMFNTHLQEDRLFPFNNLIMFYKAEISLVYGDFSGGLS